MENSPTLLLVVAAAIQDRRGLLLLQQCPPGKRHSGLWEFPGGKVETGENPRVALCRELAEELAMEVDPEAIEPAGFAEEPPDPDSRHIVMLLYTCRQWRGEPRALEKQDWRWFTPAEAWALALPPMDRALLATLCAESIANPGMPAYVPGTARP